MSNDGWGWPDFLISVVFVVLLLLLVGISLYVGPGGILLEPPQDEHRQEHHSPKGIDA